MAAEANAYRNVSLRRLNVEEVEQNLQNLEPNEQINLSLSINNTNFLGFFFSNLPTLILEKRNNIHAFDIDNECEDSVNSSVVLYYFILFIWNNNETKNFEYGLFWEHESIHLDCATQLADALRSNNNGIHTFSFMGTFENQEGAQRVWDSILDTGVQDLSIDLQLPSDDDDFNTEANYDDDDDERKTIDPTFDLVSFSNNKTLKKLDLEVCPSMSKCINMTTLFDAMKTKKELWSLEMNIHNDYFRRKERLLAKDMLRQNRSLTYIEIVDNIDTGNMMVWDGSDHDEQNAITTSLNSHRDWNTYKAMPVFVPADANEAETAKTSKVRALVELSVNTKINKPILHATITFILLNEYGLVVITDDENNENGILLHPIYSGRDEDVMFMQQLPMNIDTIDITLDIIMWTLLVQVAVGNHLLHPIYSGRDEDGMFMQQLPINIDTIDITWDIIMWALLVQVAVGNHH